MDKLELQLRKEFGVFLREKRLKANLTQREMALLCGYESPQYISNIERGKCPVSPKLLAIMATQYKIKPERLAKLYNKINLKILEREILASS